MTESALSWGGHEEAQAPGLNNQVGANETTGGGEGQGIAPICIGTVDGPLRAEIVRSFLEQAGISVYLQGESIAAVYGLVAGPLGVVRVFVPAAQAEEAARLFAELDFSDAAFEPGQISEEEWAGEPPE